MYDTIEDVVWKIENGILVIMWHEYRYAGNPDWIETRLRYNVTARQAVYIDKVMNSNIEFFSNSDKITMLKSLANIDWN